VRPSGSRNVEIVFDSRPVLVERLEAEVGEDAADAARTLAVEVAPRRHAALPCSSSSAVSSAKNDDTAA